MPNLTFLHLIKRSFTDKSCSKLCGVPWKKFFAHYGETSPLRNLSYSRRHYCAQKPSTNAPLSSSLPGASNPNSLPLHLSYTQVKDDPLTSEQKMQYIKAEYQLYKEEGSLEVPSNVKDNEWAELFDIPSASGRKKYLRYLFLIEMQNINDLEKKSVRRQYSEAYREKVANEIENEPHISYGLWRNSILIKYQDKNMDNVNNHRLVTSKLFGQPIIFDQAFDFHMRTREKRELAQQLSACYGLNRSYADPFYIHMFNFQKNDRTSHFLENTMPGISNNQYLLDVHSENYLDHFDKSKLVYLTPFCRHDMTEYDHDAVYIIGSLIDTKGSEPVTLAKAKREGIRVQRLPLDRYLNWGNGKKTLPLNQIIGILLEMKHTGSWMKAFNKYIPKRFIKEDLGHRERLNRQGKNRHYTGLKALFTDD